MWFGILGPLLVSDGDTVIGVPAARQRVLLAALLVRAGQAVPADELAEVVWDGTPPDGAITTLRSHVMRLRRALGPSAGSRVVTRYPGYLVEAGDEEVDLLRFTSLCRDGGAAVRAGAWAKASAMLAEALGLWRGAPLADIPCERLHRDQGPGLVQLRLQAVEWRIDADLHLGCHGGLVPELQSLTAEHPLRERFHDQLMLALYRSGRQAEALAAYQHARRVLVEELGAEPSTGLRELHQRILAADPTLTVPQPAPLERAPPEPAPPDPVPPPAGGPGTVVPRELPGTVPHFVGRAAELAALTALLDQADHQTPGTVVISAIGGTAGVGKTALAVRWAHQAAERFPDGQLYVNLRGYDPGQPMTAGDALAGFLRALGVPGPDIPAETEQRAARYRSLLAGRRILVVADNAGSVEQVRPLLPGTAGSVVVVTSRDALAGLVARDGARRVDLDLLPLADAVGLLRALIGDRVDADPHAAAALAAQCSRLPLALRVVAEFTAAHPAVPLADLARELADQQQRLDLLDAGGDTRTTVRTVFSWSYRHLDDDAARAFRLLGLHRGPDLDRYAVAALTATTLGQARHLLNQLAGAYLIQRAGAGRHCLHDLLRAYTRELAAADDEDERRAALTRLFDYYLHTAAAAMDILFPAESHRRPHVPPPATPAPALTDPATARAWLDAERASLVAVAAHAWPGHTTRLAAILFRYLYAADYSPEAIAILNSARRAARDTGDRAAEATALTSLGLVDCQQGRYQQATDDLQQALDLSCEIGNTAGQARALANLGLVHLRQGRHQQATAHFQQALALHRETSDRTGQARALANLGAVDLRQGRYQQATAHFQQALALHRETSDPNGEAEVLSRLGLVSLRQGRYQQATDHHRQALDLFRKIGDRTGEAGANTRLGDVDLRQGRYQQATDHHRQALDLFRETGDRSGEAGAINGLGEVLIATGQPSAARAQHTAALCLASQIGDKYEQARAHNGLARACLATGKPGQARHHWQEAVTLYTNLGAPEADQIRAQLTAADNGDRR
jgi:DNA-binding SARP family transcriptional activator/tetratricopeptide (TPR) repeat protein